MGLSESESRLPCPQAPLGKPLPFTLTLTIAVALLPLSFPGEKGEAGLRAPGVLL